MLIDCLAWQDSAIGSDTGGSIRLPASYTETIGFKPSYGRLSRHGLVAYASSLDTVGIISKQIDVVRRIFRKLYFSICCCAQGSWLLTGALDQHDERDPTAIPSSYRHSSSSNASGPLRIGVPLECFPKELSVEAIRSVRTALKRLSKREGTTVSSVSVPSIPHTLSAYYVLATAEASSNLARYDGVRYGFRSKGDYSDTRTEAFGGEVQKRIILGTYALTAE